ncbi:MAG: TrmH family RNA methyltransferase [bacterium]|nr:TrmH family RNA methyltransferase [bacterium]
MRINDKKIEITAVLHNIRSLHNVGSMFRTADGVGVSKIYLTGYTPAPTDVFGKTRPEIAKTALGAEKTVAWEQKKDISRLIADLKKQGFLILALEQAKNSISYDKLKLKKGTKAALIVGNEVRGVASGILKKCDKILEIPMRGQKESLNVSTSFGIAVYQLVK